MGIALESSHFAREHAESSRCSGKRSRATGVAMNAETESDVTLGVAAVAQRSRRAGHNSGTGRVALCAFRLLILATVSLQNFLHAADNDLHLPTLVAVDSDLAAAVVRGDKGNLMVIRRGDPIGPGRWRLDSVAKASVILVTTTENDREAGTRVRLYVEADSTPPLIVRREAPVAPLAPRLVLETGTMMPVVTGTPDQPKDQP